MHKKRIAITLLMIICFLTACAQTPNSEERNGVMVAAGGDSYHDNQENKEETEDSPSVVEATEGDLTESIDNSVEEEILKILVGCADVKIERTINAAGGSMLFIDADVNVDGIERVSQYEYELADITEEKRAALFEAMFSEHAETAVYDELNDVWTLDIDPEIRNYFLYQINHSNGGTTIPGELIIVLENRYYNLYPFEDNRLASLSDSKVNITLDEVTAICGQVLESITDTDDYVVDYVQAYGNNGRRPYYKIVFKRILDGMPVTAYNNFIFLYDNNGIERLTGSLFSTKEIGLEETILSPEEAVNRLKEQTAFLNFDGESQVTVSKITLEYVVTITPAGKILATPVWRFWLGEDEEERCFFGHRILGIDAITGELIWEERGQTM
ncbi:MAG: hypothetical protein J1E03_12350 [Acetatifactor sp.]|nr:hypothetical protein [Acetatifactor sp.]